MFVVEFLLKKDDFFLLLILLYLEYTVLY